MNPFFEKREKKLHADVAFDMNFPEHFHEEMELFMVTEGAVEVNVMGKKQTLTAGDCAVIFPEQIHSYKPACESRSYILIFGSSFMGSYRRSIQTQIPDSPFLEHKVLSEDVKLAFERICQISGHGNNQITETIADPMMVSSAWIQVILALIMPVLKLQERKENENMGITGELIQYIMEHYREPLTLELLAQKLHINKYYLSHVFSDKLRTSFPQYLNQIRLDHALYEMRNTEQAIGRIWEEAGFNSQRSFNRVFRENVGMTPKEYRKKFGGICL